MDAEGGPWQKGRVPTIPLWAVALMLAAAAPFAVRLLADTLDARYRARTREALRAATEDAGPHAPGADDP